MYQDNPPPYSANAPPPGMNVPPHQPPLQPMKPSPYPAQDYIQTHNQATTHGNNIKKK